ncbi:MAG: sugar transferase [Desulfurivibrionaceae bacterium]
MSLAGMLKMFNDSVAPGQENRTGGIYGEKEFSRILARERARAERSTHRFSLIVFENGERKLSSKEENDFLTELTARMRVTDEAGWLRQNRIGVILHNASTPDAWKFARKIRSSLLTAKGQLLCKVYSYPPPRKNNTGTGRKLPEETIAEDGAGQQFNCGMEELQQLYTRKMTRKKRSLDFLGSLAGLIILSPLFLFICCLIKVVSPGPAFYRQTRIGRGGRPFTLLKFRTMAVNADNSEHREHLSTLIQGGKDPQDCAQAMRKLDDSNCHIIRFGKLLRKTYLDELPQLINVLRGDMSLIGPRPPIPYEVAEYQLWHTGRLDTAPGMTGLWQVSGKNDLTFNQMVRLDIRYSRKQSFRLDLKILLMTPMVIATELKGSLSKLGGHFIGAGEEAKYRSR